ncbi:MAG: hypothetical protein H5U20_00475, partial [Rhodobacteraceae bacterium]|nr:hypothetical protein [Paracoccaceae bacterium]
MRIDPAETIANLAPWDVIYPFDDRARPKKHKMWVCVAKSELWFIGINTEAYGRFCVPLPKALHAFLEWDSYFGGSGDMIEPLDADLFDLLAKQSMPEKQGIVGHDPPQRRAGYRRAARQAGRLPG